MGCLAGDRSRSARLGRLRELVPVADAIVGIDLADNKRMVVVRDHDSQVLTRRLLRPGAGRRDVRPAPAPGRVSGRRPRSSAEATRPASGISRAHSWGPTPAASADTCIQGFVWREVVPVDHVCVTPETRQQIVEDNRLAESRRRSAAAGRAGATKCRRCDALSWCPGSPRRRDDHRRLVASVLSPSCGGRCAQCAHGRYCGHRCGSLLGVTSRAAARLI